MIRRLILTAASLAALIALATPAAAYPVEVGNGTQFRCGTTVLINIGKPVPTDWQWGIGTNEAGPNEVYRALFIGGNVGAGIPDGFHDWVAIRNMSSTGAVLLNQGNRPIGQNGGGLIGLVAGRSDHIRLDFSASAGGTPYQRTWCGHGGARIETTVQ